MVLRWPVWSVLCLLVLTGAFAGCVSDDAPEPKASEETDEGGGADTANKTASGRKVATVSADTAIYAPKWNVGQSWTYEVSGSRVEGGYTTTIGVVEEADDHYVMGADEREFQEALTWRSTLMMEGVQKDSLAVLQGSNYQDLIGFNRDVGETWKAHVFNKEVTLTKVAVQTVAHGAGESTGIRVEASGSGHSFVIEYASDVEGIALFEWSTESGTVLKYALTGAAESGTTGLLRWEVKGTKTTRATGGFSTLGHGLFKSDGSGDHMFLVAESMATYGVGKLFDPDNEEAIGVQSVQDEHVRHVVTVPDKAGEWTGAAVVRSGMVSVHLYQIQIVQY